MSRTCVTIRNFDHGQTRRLKPAATSYRHSVTRAARRATWLSEQNFADNTLAQPWRYTVKVLETQRLILRPFTLDDAEFIYELVNQPSWKRYIGDRGVDSLAAARTYIETVPLAAYRQHGFGLFAVERKADSILIGTCGLLKRETLKDVDIGFALIARYEGQGLMYEAAAATLVYCRDTLGLARVVAIVKPDNTRSARLLERLGMREEGIIRLGGASDEVRLYGIALRAEAQPDMGSA